MSSLPTGSDYWYRKRGYESPVTYSDEGTFIKLCFFADTYGGSIKLLHEVLQDEMAAGYIKHDSACLYTLQQLIWEDLGKVSAREYFSSKYPVEFNHDTLH